MKKFIFTFAFVLAVVVYPARSRAKVWTVNCNGGANFTKIQDAINASSNGDTILVTPCTYTQNLVFNGRAVTITSTDPNNPTVVATTIITVSSGDSVKFDFGEGSNSVLTGFTITGGGINCYGSSPTISKNVIKNCPGEGIYGQSAAAPIISDNKIRLNGGAGIYSCNGLIIGNSISHNNGGISECQNQNSRIIDNIISDNSRTTGGSGGGLYLCHGEISGNEIKNNYASFYGGGLYGCNGNISGNIIAGNIANSAGGGLFSCQGDISHNIISGNISFDGGGLYGCNGYIYNNTIVGNRAVYGGAIRDCTGYVWNNIIAFNEIFVGGEAAGIYGFCNNSFNDFWNQGGNFGSGASRGQGDIVENPLFIVNGWWDNRGTPDPSDDVWHDGDYHVKSAVGRWNPNPPSVGWIKDDVNSPCIDAGYPASDWTEELWPHGRRINQGVYGGTPEASMSANKVGNAADIDDDGWIDYNDLMLVAQMWLSDEKPLAEDIDRDVAVDFQDFAVLCANWKPQTPPTPNPMTWATPPYATSSSSIAMVATTATTTDGSGVEYYFEDVNHPQHNSGWVSFGVGVQAMWEDTGLTANTKYWYRVKTRNKGNLLETDWSIVASATTPGPPTPNPMTWATPPYATSDTSIAMVATTATSTDGSGVEYYFEDVNHPQHNSGWISFGVGVQARWEDTGLTANTKYWYRVKARNKTNHLETGWSNVASATTPRPPTPDPMTWATLPRATSSSSIEMVATTATTTDGSGVDYYFEDVNHLQHNSGWISFGVGVQALWEDTGLTSSTKYWYRVKARNKGNRLETAWSIVAYATTSGVDVTAPTPNPMDWAPDGEPKEIYGGGGTWDYYATMTAVEATDASGVVEYYFQCTTDGRYSSPGWLSFEPGEPCTYNVLVGQKNRHFYFRVKARDLYGNETDFSEALPADP